MLLREADLGGAKTGEQTSVTTWKLDPAHSSASFSVRHMMISTVRGEFKEIEGTMKLDPENIDRSSVEARIKTSSIYSHDENRDTHLRSADFFDVANFPDITFKSTSIRRTVDGEFDVMGDLTIRGVTKQVTLKAEGPTEEMKDPWGGTRIGVTATTKISRKDFGLTWNVALETGGFLVGDDIKITIDAQFVKES